jgi:excisionase family DNA binding protein
VSEGVASPSPVRRVAQQQPLAGSHITTTQIVGGAAVGLLSSSGTVSGRRAVEVTTSNIHPDAWPDLMQVPDMCDYLDITEGTGRRLIRDGVIPIVKIGGKKKSRIRVRRVDLDALIEANYHPATSGPLARNS